MHHYSKMKRKFYHAARPGAVCFTLFLWMLIMSIYSVPTANAKNYIKIGLLEEPKTLNVWLATDAWSSKVLSQIYQPLYIREPKNLELTPWLAAENPVYDAKALTYTVKMRPAKWSDGTELTSEDVAFTGRLIKTLRVPRYLSSWEFIKKIETPDKRTVRFILREPKAIFESRTLTTPIVQKERWEAILQRVRNLEKPLLEVLKQKIKDPISSGPFVLKEWRKGAYVFLEKNEHFFGRGLTIGGYDVGPHIDGIIFKFFGTSDAAVLALQKGSIDMFWWGLQEGYLADLEEHKNVKIYTSEKSALYYVGFNLREKPFNDLHFRKAVALATDKHFIVKRILQGYALQADSIVPSSNAFWYDPNVPRYGDGLNRDERIRKAYEVLKEGGYTWEDPPVNDKGEIVEAEEIRLPDGSEMERLTILTPPADYDPQRAMLGIMIQEWLKMLGIPATSKPMPLGSLIQQVKTRHDFDLFVLGYGNLSLDPDYLRNFFISRNSKPKGWNTSGYNNPRFDVIADASADAMNREERRKLIWEMQEILMQDLPWLPIYTPKLAEGVREDRFTGWVDMVGGIGNRWSFCVIKPVRKN
ncbi:MAG: ABC transporter substrate-binding protein [Deltaproteobacteria bacterium]|nr:ABC transporter substrate-binding protein [Deltaproteobacteria bacterium]